MARILVAEDDKSVRAFVCRALETMGHDVIAVSDGGEALVALESERVDLLLTDIVMPVMDGIALALKVSSTHPNLPILMMTGYAAERQRAHNLDELINEVISKPFSIAELKMAVQHALSSKQESS